MHLRKSWALACLILFSSCAKQEIPKAPDWIIVGNTGSMEPTFHGGELRLVSKIPYDQLVPGQIVLTYFGSNWHPHRLKFKRLGRWYTQGDAVDHIDEIAMTEENYGGVVKEK